MKIQQKAPSPYLVPAEPITLEQEIKKSRFIAKIAHAPTREQAMDYIQKMRDEFPDARHHCWAFIAGNPSNTTEMGMSDDGEPHGTAGKPMLNVLSHKQVGEIVAVVIRYFGGIKLGTGGLVRAYSGAVQEAMEVLPTIKKTPSIPLSILFPYEYENTIRQQLQKPEVTLVQVDYGEQVTMSLEVEISAKESFCEEIKDLTNGKGTVLS